PTEERRPTEDRHPAGARRPTGAAPAETLAAAARAWEPGAPVAGRTGPAFVSRTWRRLRGTARAGSSA
ncbi:hypothetical protein ACFRMQ_40065, partial [Kitasatospora sp. NPDC056783]